MRTDRRLSAIMFTDVVGYSAMVNADERRARELLDLQARLLRGRLRQYGGRHIDAIGDGNLAIFDSALGAVECAVALQHDLWLRNRREPPERQLRLRVGLHQGDVERRGGQVYGDGVNVCARIEPLAPHGGIAASELVVQQVHGPLRSAFEARGPRALKNIPEPVELFTVGEEALANAAAQLAPPRRRGAALPALALAAVAALGGASAYWWPRGPVEVETPSLAILPLENLSSEPGSAEFAAGLHDALLTEVARLPGLRVISRSSVMRYARERPGSPEIGRQLGVGNILEGSLQRSGDRLRLNVQLIRADTDEHLWAEIYERDVGAIFQVQNDIARAVARKIHGNVVFTSLPEAQRPSSSAEAYDLFLRAIASEEGDIALGLAAPHEPLRLLERALELDADFAMAHAAVARFCVWGAHWAAYNDPSLSAGYVDRAEQAARRAMALAPQRPESLYAMGMAVSWRERRAAAAEPWLVKALALRADYAPALYALSGIYSALGRSAESVDTIRALLDVDPNNEKAHEQLALELVRTRAYAEAETAVARWAQASSDPAYARKFLGRLKFYRTGDTASWKAALDQAGSGMTAEIVTLDRAVVAGYEGRLADAAAVGRALADAFVAGTSDEALWAMLVGQSLVLDGHAAEAEPYLQAAERRLRRDWTAQPKDRLSLTSLGEVVSLQGRHEEADALLAQATALAQELAGQPRSTAYYEAFYAQVAARARSGRRDEALAGLELLLREPSDVHAHEVLRNPLLRPLDRDPAFQALVRRYLPA